MKTAQVSKSDWEVRKEEKEVVLNLALSTWLRKWKGAPREAAGSEAEGPIENDRHFLYLLVLMVVRCSKRGGIRMPSPCVYGFDLGLAHPAELDGGAFLPFWDVDSSAELVRLDPPQASRRFASHSAL